jgi:hypothetical protein
MARTALLHSKLPQSLRGEAITHAAFTKNRTSHKALGGKGPLKVYHQHIDIAEERKRLRTSGESVWVHIPNESDKLAPRSVEGVIVGYGSGHKIYRVYTEDRRIKITENPQPRIKTITVVAPHVIETITETLNLT